MSARLVSRGWAGFVALAVLSLACGPDKHNIDGPTTLSVASVFPNVGVLNTATDVRITGLGFAAGATVTIGGAATNVIVVSSAVITATTPIHSDGKTDVIVTNPGGESASLAGGFTYLPPLTLTVISVSPVEGLVGDLLRVTGTKFQTGAKVTVDGLPVVGFSSVTASTSIVVEAPTHGAGKVDVTVTNPDGESATRVGAFTYQLVTLSVSANAVSTGGSLSVSWAASGNRSASSDWIALYKAGAAAETYVDGWWEYTKGLATGTLTLTAPTVPGSYEFRYLTQDGFGVAAQSGIIVVSPLALTPPAAQSPDRRWPLAGRESRWR